MAESSLALKYEDFLAAVGHFLGYGRSSAGWTAEQLAEIDGYVQDGVRQVYDPPVVPGERASHQWSFLRPRTTLTTVAATGEYTLPDDWGAHDGPFTLESATQRRAAILIVGDGMLDRMRQGNPQGFPKFASIVPLNSSTTTAGQRNQVRFCPVPDQVWTLSYRYHAIQHRLEASRPYPLGGARYAQLFRQSCLAAAELHANDSRGVHREEFLVMLAAAVANDRKSLAAEHLDPRAYGSETVQDKLAGYVKYNDVVYGPLGS